MKTHTTVQSWGAIALASVCIAGTGYVLFEDVLRGGTVNVSHVTGVIALVVTIAAGHMLWPRLLTRPFAALGLALLFAGGTGYVVITSAGRTAHVMADKALEAAAANARYTQAMADLDAAKKVAAKSKSEAAGECGSGKKTKCEGKQFTADKDDAYMWTLQVRADNMKPVSAQSDYLQAAKLIAVITGKPEKTIEANLALLVPFLLVLICEAGAVVFGNLAFEHRQLPAPPQVQALTFERPLTTQETDELKAVLKLTKSDVLKMMSDGMKQHQIAALYGLNQGRISEILSGKRESVEV
jgi:hypothetical protein